MLITIDTVNYNLSVKPQKEDKGKSKSTMEAEIAEGIASLIATQAHTNFVNKKVQQSYILMITSMANKRLDKIIDVGEDSEE